MNNKLLSICMIVKDEEDVLDRCLNSISKLADEIIIIDTGSIDRTKDIASQYTNHVYDYVWCNDFSAARNESLKYATSKWVLVLDADEYVESKDIPLIRDFLKKEAPASNTIYGISVVSFLGKSIRTGNLTEAAVSRLLPNHFGIHFYRPIHEQLCSKEGLPLITKKAPIHVYHTGYLQETMSKKDKSSRNKKIFSNLKSKTGFTAYDYFTIGNEYSVQNDYKKALYYYEKSYKKSNPNTNWHYICVFEIINNYLRFDRYNEAWELLEKESSGKKDYPDYYCMQGIIYEHFGLYEQAKKSFKTALDKSEYLAITNPIFWLVNPSLALETPLNSLISIAMREHNSQDATYYLIKKIKSDPSDYVSLVKLLELTLHNANEDAVKKLIELLFPNIQTENSYLLFKVFLTLGQRNLARTYYSSISDKNLLSIQDILRYELLCGNKETFEAILSQSKINLLSKEISQIISLAYLIWDLKTDISLYAEEVEEEEVEDGPDSPNRFYTSLLNNQYSEEWIVRNQTRIFELVTDLFQLGMYETFDSSIKQFSHPVIVDLLANYFYSKHNYDIAISYYNILIDSDKLSLTSYINLAFLHVNDQLYDDSIPFFEAAIHESPLSRQLYIQLLTYCNNPDIRLKYLNQLFQHYSHYRKLPFLQQLL